MVRNNELRETSEATLMLAPRIRSALKAHGYSQEQVGAMISRGQSYVSLRCKGLKPWNWDELDTIAQHLGYHGAPALIGAICADTAAEGTAAEG